MQQVKSILAKNIADLRILNNMTQLELGEKLSYSDKTVSKWERGDSTPDITVLVEMADLFGVTLDDLVRTENIEAATAAVPQKEGKRYNRRVISYLAESIGWVVAIFAFIITSLILGEATFQWLYFAYTLPVALIVKLVLNTIWFNPRHNYMIISALMWSLLTAVYVTFLYFSVDVSLIYILGIAGQVVIVLWSFIDKPKAK